MLLLTLYLSSALVAPSFGHWHTSSVASVDPAPSDRVSANGTATSASSAPSINSTIPGSSSSNSTGVHGSATSTASSSSSKSTGKTHKNSKRGLSYPAANNPEDVLNFNQTRSVVSWIYDWAITPPDYLANTGIEYVPMQWGGGNIENLASIMAMTGAKTLLAFNEPDFDEQSNMDPTYAAELWMKYIEPLKEKGVRLGGPAVTSSPSGRPWLMDFFAACTHCTFDFLPLHWYGVGSAGFYDYLWSVHSQWPDMKLWITEYADTETNYDDVLLFMNTTAAYLDDLDWVERYAWFGYFRPEKGTYYNMLDDDGGLNKLGEFYVGAPSVEKSGRVTHSVTLAQGPTAALATATVGTNIATPSFSGGERMVSLPQIVHPIIFSLGLSFVTVLLFL